MSNKFRVGDVCVYDIQAARNNADSWGAFRDIKGDTLDVTIIVQVTYRIEGYAVLGVNKDGEPLRQYVNAKYLTLKDDTLLGRLVSHERGYAALVGGGMAQVACGRLRFDTSKCRLYVRGYNQHTSADVVGIPVPDLIRALSTPTTHSTSVPLLGGGSLVVRCMVSGMQIAVCGEAHMFSFEEVQKLRDTLQKFVDTAAEEREQAERQTNQRVVLKACKATGLSAPALQSIFNEWDK